MTFTTDTAGRVRPHANMSYMAPPRKTDSEQRKHQPLTGIRLDPATDKALRVKLAAEDLTKQSMLETLIRAWLLPPKVLAELGGLERLSDLHALRAEMEARNLFQPPE
jgi:hypothetical protein